MLKRLLRLLDIFLPAEFAEVVELPLLYRGRIIVATNLVTLLGAVGALMTFIAVNPSTFIHVGVIFCILTLIGHIYFLKKQFKNYESNLIRGATCQIFVISGLIYITAFCEKGMGIFGLIWLIPVFLMIAFFFNTRLSFYFAAINFILFFWISYYKYDHFFDPLKNSPHFLTVFYIFLTLIIALSYFLAFLFVHLNEDLQSEVIKQRDLLVESAKFQSLGQMASNLAHDINNPLFTIQGKLHQMRNLLSRDQLDLEKCDQIVESIETTILKLSQVVKGISTFAREGRGDQMVSIGVAELIESNLALALDRIKSLDIDLEIKIAPETVVICYPSFISQIILNLINNSIDALEAAVVKKITVRAFAEGTWIYIIISDTGAGVPKGNEKKIFDPFFTTKTFGKGTGLGLSISKGLAEVHDGQLTYERTDNITHFILKLPSYE